MLDSYQATTVFVVLAVVIGTIIFGGTTLIYFLEKRSPGKPAPGNVGAGTPQSQPAVGHGRRESLGRKAA